MGVPGNEPEGCARDFIKNCYYYYPCGVYWYDVSDIIPLNPEYVDSSIQPLFIPKLICDAVKDQMDDVDKILSVLSVQHAFENILSNVSKIKPNSVHLHYVYILCIKLHNVCLDLPESYNKLLFKNFKLLLQICKPYKEDIACIQEDEVKATEPVKANEFLTESSEIVVMDYTTASNVPPSSLQSHRDNEVVSVINTTKVPIIYITNDPNTLLIRIFVPISGSIKMFPFCIKFTESLEHKILKIILEEGLWQFIKDKKYDEHKFCFNLLQKAIANPITDCFSNLKIEITKIIVVQQNIAHPLPFSALQDQHNQTFYGNMYNVINVPSLSYLINKSVVVEIPAEQNSFLIAGNPVIPPFIYGSEQQSLKPLPYADEEIFSVANIVGTPPLHGTDATKDAVLGRLQLSSSSPLQMIHIATHGLNSPSGLAFSPSKYMAATPEHILITPNEISSLSLSTVALVVLSCCDSGQSQLIGNRCIGIGNAFLSAGAHSVLVSQWRMEDRSGCIFM